MKIPSDDFWYLTPYEYSLIIKAHYDNQQYVNRDILEAIRVQTFYLANLKKGVTYNTFKKDFAFPWDKESKVKEEPKAIGFKDEEVFDFLNDLEQKDKKKEVIKDVKQLKELTKG